MLVSLEKRAVFAHIPKTGGGSITEVLLNKGFVEYSDPHINRLRDFPNFFRACMVRNPYAIVASYYIHKKVAGLDIAFDEFVNEVTKMRSGDKILNQAEYALDCNFVMRYESYDKDFRKFCDIIGVEYVKPDNKIHNYNNYNWKDLYTDNTAAVVYEKARTDFNVLGYGRKWKDG